MTHTRRFLTRTFLALALFSTGLLLADAVDDAITTHTGTYTTKQTEAVELPNMFGDDRETEATSIKTTLDTLLTDIQAVIDNTAGLGLVPSAGQNTTLTTLKTDVQTLHDRVVDHVTLGAHHATTASALEKLAKLSITRSQTNNLTDMTDGLNIINSHVVDVETMHTANEVGVGTAGALKSADSVTEFGSERARALLAQELAVLAQTMLTKQSNLGTALNAAPDPSDDSISATAYDTQLNTAQAAIETEANAVATAATAAYTKATEIVAGDVGSDDYADFIADAADEAGVRVNQFKEDAEKTVKKVAVTRADIGARIVQRQLLFDARNYSERESVKASLAEKFATRKDANDQLQGTFAGIAELIESDTTTFPDTPPPVSGEGRSAMGQLVDAKVAAYLKKVEGEINKLNPDPSNQELIDNVIENLKPATYLRETAQAMIDWLNVRPKKLALAGDFAATRTQYETEWAELDAELTANRDESTISSATKSGIASDQSSSKYTDITPIATPLGFKKAARALGRRPFGPASKIRLKGVAEYKAMMGVLIPEVDKGSVDKPATHRSENIKPAPITRPLEGSPDILVSGESTVNETLDDGNSLVMTGDDEGTGRIRDLAFLNTISNKLTADLKIYMNKGAVVHLGAGNVQKNPGLSPNVLGGVNDEATKSVQLLPDGNCTVWLNSDILITGGKAFIPTKDFGKGAEHQMVFRSEVPRKITVAKNTTLDLSEFGNDGKGYVDNGKQIVFADNVSLVLEPGAKIRFPHVDPNKEKKGVVLYFNDNAKLVCQGDSAMVGSPFVGAKILDADCYRNKLIGMGQLWFNKKAAMEINAPAMMSIEADYKTADTNITLSFQRNAELRLGGTIAGGALQVGNIVKNGSSPLPHGTPDENFPSDKRTTIDFTLRLDGPGATCTLGRSGFLGLAAGAVNKYGAQSFLKAGPNGIDGVANTAWQLQRLYDVNNITIDIVRGYFDHQIIADGTNEDCSILAVGPLANKPPQSKYLLRLGKPNQAFIRGGGNVYYVDTDASMAFDETDSLVANPHTVDLTDGALNLSFSTTNTGKYSVLAPSKAIRTRSDEISGLEHRVYGRGVVKTDVDSYVFAGPLEEFFYSLRLSEYSSTNEKVVPLARVDNDNMIALVNDSTIVREVVSDVDVTDGTAANGLAKGYLRGALEDGGRPIEYRKPR